MRELAYLRAEVELDYDRGVPEGAVQALEELFHRQELLIEKRTKRKQLAQNPGLNPQLLEKAIARYLPELTPDFVRVRRRQLLDAAGRVFR